MSRNNGTFSADGLDGLLRESSDAQQYFNSLPVYVQDMIRQREQSIQSEDELRRYAENIVEGDK